MSHAGCSAKAQCDFSTPEGTCTPHSRKPQTGSFRRGLAFAEHLIRQVCWAWPDLTYLQRIRANRAKQGIQGAFARHKTPALFNWSIEVASYQGKADPSPGPTWNSTDRYSCPPLACGRTRETYFSA